MALLFFCYKAIKQQRPPKGFLDLEVAIVAIDALMKNVERQMLHHLRENKLAGIHGSPLRTLLCEDGWTSGKISSRLMA